MAGLREVVEWDVVTWSRAVRYWETVFKERRIPAADGLELGARHGGLSCFFAAELGCRMVCTDVDLSGSRAMSLHERHGVGDLVTYAEVDAKKLPYDVGAFDFVVFKSVLGVVGARGQKHQQAAAIREIGRVLKPGGLLFFAENLQGSRVHQLARKMFVRWGKSWTYVTLAELHELLAGSFQSHDLRSTGLTSAFVPKPEALRSAFALLDGFLVRWVPPSWNYVAYGHAVR